MRVKAGNDISDDVGVLDFGSSFSLVGGTKNPGSDNGYVALSNGGSQTYVVPSGSDDSTAIAAAGQDIGLRVGTYQVNTGVTLASQTIIQGRGMADADFTSALTKITCNTDGVNVLRVNAVGVVMEKFAIQWNGAGTPTGGAGVYLPASNGMRIADVAVKGLYNNFVLGGFYWTARGILSVDAVNYGIYIQNSVPDHGDAVISDSFVVAGPNNNGNTGIKWESGGGLKIVDTKISGFAGKAFTAAALDIHALSTVNTSEITVADTVVDGSTGTMVNVNVDAGGGLTGISFDDVFVRGSFNPTQGYVIRAVSDVKIVGGSVELSSNALSCIDIDTTGRVTIEGVELGGIPVGNPLIKLGSSTTGARVRFGNLKSSSGAGGSTWTTGTNQWILRNLGTGTTPTGGGGNVYEFSWRHPSITSNSVYSNLWKLVIPTGGGCVVEFALFCQNPAGTGPTGVVVRQRRLLLNNPSGTIAVTTLDTDAATSTDIDVQWNNIGSSALQINAKINTGSTYTGLGSSLYSNLRVIGSIQDLFGYS